MLAAAFVASLAGLVGTGCSIGNSVATTSAGAPSSSGSVTWAGTGEIIPTPTPVIRIEIAASPNKTATPSVEGPAPIPPTATATPTITPQVVTPTPRAPTPVAPTPAAAPQAVVPTVTAQGQFILVEPGQDLQALVNANPPGTRFRLAAGVHQPDTVQPKDGNWFVGMPDAILDGGGTRRFAFRNVARATDVVIQALEIRNYAPGRAYGAIDFTTYRWQEPGDENFETTDYGVMTNWRLESLWVHHNDGDGIVVGSGARLKNIRSADNSWLGIGGHGENIIIDGGILARNSAEALATDNLNWHSGGMKITVARDITVRNMHVVDNHGLGIWLDISVINGTVENNLVEDNAGVGIFYEISYDGKILNNVVRGNAHQDDRGWLSAAGIAVSSSTEVVVRGNHVEDSPAGLTVLDNRVRRAEGWLKVPPLLRGPQAYEASNVVLEANVVCRAERNGIGIDRTVTDPEVYETTRFDNNTYFEVTFTGQQLPRADLATWQNDAGQDQSSKLVDSCPAWTDPRTRS